MRRRCVVLLLLLVWGATPVLAAGAPAPDSPRAPLAALWDRVAGSLVALWDGFALAASHDAQRSEPGSNDQTDSPPPTPEEDNHGTLDPNG